LTIIGERLNPTGKPVLKKALIEGNMEFLLDEARAQVAAGADALDINAGLFELDEPTVLSDIIKTFNGVLDVPFCLDSSNAVALERAARYVNGLPLLNSVNGKTSSLEAILPIAKKYGAPVVCLLMDENGVPASLDERIKIAEKIIKHAERYGIEKHKLVFDCLTLTASAEQEKVVDTLKAVRIISEKYGCNTVLGLSNVSFGLPLRPQINSVFLSHALASGLTSAILNPLCDEVMRAVSIYKVLYNVDKGAKDYVEKYKDKEVVLHQAKSLSEQAKPSHDELIDSVIKGKKDASASLTRQRLELEDGLSVINKYLIPALDRVGMLYEKGAVYLPELLLAANAAKAAFDVVKQKSEAAAVARGTVLLATVFGDVHDIGKNIAKMLLENYGYTVLDLGKDVPVDTILKTLKENDIKLVGLSALMTTTLNNMKETISEIRKVSKAKIMVGGAVVTEENSRLIGADYYCKDAIDGVSVARKMFD
jgi:5-methyltetrahydrofolate--homocysteine methyltransferase